MESKHETPRALATHLRLGSPAEQVEQKPIEVDVKQEQVALLPPHLRLGPVAKAQRPISPKCESRLEQPKVPCVEPLVEKAMPVVRKIETAGGPILPPSPQESVEAFKVTKASPSSVGINEEQDQALNLQNLHPAGDFVLTPPKSTKSTSSGIEVTPETGTKPSPIDKGHEHRILERTFGLTSGVLEVLSTGKDSWKKRPSQAQRKKGMSNQVHLRAALPSVPSADKNREPGNNRHRRESTSIPAQRQNGFRTEVPRVVTEPAPAQAKSHARPRKSNSASSYSNAIQNKTASTVLLGYNAPQSGTDRDRRAPVPTANFTNSTLPSNTSKLQLAPRHSLPAPTLDQKVIDKAVQGGPETAAKSWKAQGQQQSSRAGQNIHESQSRHYVRRPSLPQSLNAIPMPPPPKFYMEPLPFSRPPPQNRAFHQPRMQFGMPMNNPYEHINHSVQAHFLNQMADIEIPKAEITSQELREKESLRVLIQGICREAITAFEQQNSTSFPPESVGLKCYGSLASGYAMHSSDMDLALTSPLSTPDPSSPTSEIPRLLEKALLDRGYGARLLTKTRVIIIRFCEKPSPDVIKALIEARAAWEIERDSPPKPELDRPRDLTENAGTGTAGSALHHAEVTKLPNSQTEVSHGNKINEMDKGNTRKAVPTSIQRTDEELVRLYKLAIEEGWFEKKEERQLITDFVRKFEFSNGNHNHPELIAARNALRNLPDVLSRYRERQDNPLDFPKIGVGIQCDINFANRLALHNTHMLRCYSSCDPRVRPMVLFVKAWAKVRKINTPYRGTLSSYAYVLMVLHYLMNIAEPRVIPNLQLEMISFQNSPVTAESVCEGYDVRFWRSESEIKLAAKRGQLTVNVESVGSLLTGFYHYYALQGPNIVGGGFNWAHSALSLRTFGGLLSKESKGWTGARVQVLEPEFQGQEPVEIKHRYLLAVEDPFETDHNIARTVVHDGIVAIRDEFRRASKIISSLGYPTKDTCVSLFAEAEERAPQKKFFGPNPAHFRPRPNNYGPQNLRNEQNFQGAIRDGQFKDGIQNKEGSNRGGSAAGSFRGKMKRVVRERNVRSDSNEGTASQTGPVTVDMVNDIVASMSIGKAGSKSERKLNLGSNPAGPK